MAVELISRSHAYLGSDLRVALEHTSIIERINLRNFSIERTATLLDRSDFLLASEQYGLSDWFAKQNNLKQQIKFLKLAADCNHATALSALGKMYVRGIGTAIECNPKKGIELLRLAVDYGPQSASTELRNAQTHLAYLGYCLWLQENQKEAMEYLRLAVDQNESVDTGPTALREAIANRDHRRVNILLCTSKTQNIDALVESGPYKGVTALWIAARDGQWEVVRALLRRGARRLDVAPETGNVAGVTTMVLAARAKQYGVVSALLELGGRKIHTGTFTSAVMDNQEMLVRGFLKQGIIIPSIQPQCGFESPTIAIVRSAEYLFRPVEMRDNKELLSSLVFLNTAVNGYKEGETALHKAIKGWRYVPR